MSITTNPMEKTFQTKTGYCHILPDKIVLTREGVIGNLAKLTVGDNITRTLLRYGIVAMLTLYLAFRAFQNERMIEMGILGAAAAYLIYGILISINNSASPVIERHTIKAVRFNAGVKFITRARFEIMFENEKGKMKRRLILLPGSWSGGGKATAQALQIMREEGLLSA